MRIKIFLLLAVLDIGAVFAQSAIHMPTAGWYVNNFADTNCGAEFACVVAPDGQNAIKARFFGRKSANLVMSPEDVKRQHDDWPETFTALKGFFWNNGCTNVVRIALRSDAGQWNARVILEHRGWQALVIGEVVNYQNKYLKFNPQEVSMIFISAEGEQPEFAVGTLYWDKAGTLLTPLPFGMTGVVVRAAQPPMLDGRLDDAIWGAIAPMPLAYFAHNQAGVPAGGNWVKAAFDQDNFYLAAFLPLPPGTTPKAQLREDNTELWVEEDFEFFVYPGSDPRQYFQFIVNPLGARAALAKIFDQTEDRIVIKFKDLQVQWQARVGVDADGWTVEAAVPWLSMGTAAPPSFVQFQAMRGDHTGATPAYPVWCPTMRRPVDNFGVLVPRDIEAPPLVIEGLTCRRSTADEIALSFFATAAGTQREVFAECWFAPPEMAPLHFAKKFTITAEAGLITWPMQTGAAISGMHQLVLRVAAAEPRGCAGGAVLYFQQTLPSRFKFADIVFNPMPKKVIWQEGFFMLPEDAKICLAEDASERTIKTAEYLAQRLYGLYGILPGVRCGGTGVIKMAIVPEKVKSAIGAEIPEAYLLEITPVGVEITGMDEAGLYYGVVTLLQAAAAPKQPGQPMCALSVVDYPSYPKRIVNTYEMFHNKKAADDEHGGYQIPRIKQWIERYVAGNKYNFLCLSWADQVNYPSLPEIHHKDNFTPEEVADLYAFAREHFIHAFPGVLLGAHAPSFTRHFPELIEKKFGTSQMDVTKPQVYELMRKLYDDLLDMAGPGVEYFQTFNDEWWHGARTQEDVVYNGKTRQELFYDFLMAEYKLLKAHGVRMVMFSDMLHPLHNGGPPFNLSAVVEKLPRDIVLATWSAQPNDYFAKLGFEELWRVDNGFSAHSRKGWAGDVGFGRIHYGSGDLFNATDQQRTLFYAFHTEFLAANYAWNKDEKEVLPNAEWTLQYMPSLMGVYAMQPNPAAGTNLLPVALPGAGQAVGSDVLPEQLEVGGIPMQSRALMIAPSVPLKIVFPAEMRISSLYILNNVAPRDQQAVKNLHQLCAKNVAARPYGPIVGAYLLKYADGASEKMLLRLGRNIALLEHTPAESRYVRDCRAVYPLREDQSLALNQFEWINPHPEREVVGLEISSVYEYAPVLVAGITARDVRASFPQKGEIKNAQTN